MNTRILFLMAAATGLFLAGCNTFQSRAREKSETFESLAPEQQQRLKRGTINVGDTQDMVYIALGTPEEKRNVTTADGTGQTWIYRTYWQQYEGTAWLGYRRIIVPAGNGRGYVIYHEPVTQDVYRTHVDETTRVIFDRNGVVSQVEESNRR
jgi:outer membrane protein assembly factor BamE (lipoprotein component of BamABCDE complex)